MYNWKNSQWWIHRHIFNKSLKDFRKNRGENSEEMMRIFLWIVGEKSEVNCGMISIEIYGGNLRAFHVTLGRSISEKNLNEFVEDFLTGIPRDFPNFNHGAT